MGKIINPTRQGAHNDVALRWMQSVYRTMTGNVQLANPAGADSTGVYNKFQPANHSGVMLRIGASGSAEPIQWTTNNTAITINHALGFQPTGYHVVDMDKDMRIYRTATPTTSTIMLAPTDASANVTVFIF